MHHCNDPHLAAVLASNPALSNIPLAVWVTHPSASATSEVGHLRRRAQVGLLDLAAWLTARLPTTSATGGMLAVVQGQSTAVDALARSVDDGAHALLEVLEQQHPNVRFCCIRWRGGDLPAHAVAAALGALAAMPIHSRVPGPILLTHQA
jgi:hypothetical protein